MKLTLDIPNRILAMVAGGGLCFVAGTVIATEFPSDDEALYYSGLLTDSAGNPRTDTPELQVELFGSATGGSALCGSAPVAHDLGASQGRFRVALPAPCTDAIRDHGDTWARVTVGSTLLPRQKLGATAYAAVARDAQQAELADSASAVEPDGVSRDALQDGAVSAAKLDPAFVASISALGTRLDSLEARTRPGGLAYSPHAIWKGASATATTGNFAATTTGGQNLTGYRAAKYLCEQALGSPTAHMCTSDEAARSAQLGLVPGQGGWIATGTATGEGKRDCQGWTNGAGTAGGVIWPAGANGAGAWDWPCNQTFKIQCCD